MRKRSRILTLVLVALAVTMLTVGGFWLAGYVNTTQVGADYPSNEVVVTSDVVSEKRPDMTKDDYSVQANQPRKITLPTLNIAAYVQKVGTTTSGDMATPNNLFFAGWYKDSPAPGDVGVSIVNGHFGGRYTEGIFRRLDSLTKGSSIRVQMGDMSLRNFEVVSVQSYALKESAEALYKDDASIQNELHLITCGGAYIDASQTYDRRIIVVARLAQS